MHIREIVGWSSINMKFAWINNLFSGAGVTFRRFPHIILCSAAVSFLLCLNNFPEYKGNLLLRLFMTFSLGIPSYFGLAMFDERYTMKRSTVYLMHGLLAGGLAIYFFTLPEVLHGVSYSRYIMLMIMVHLGVAFAPFMVNDDLNAFWQYNRILLLRFIIAFLFSMTLFAGLALAIYSIQSLFNILLDTTIIKYVFYCCITLNTWLFLNGTPKRVDLLGNDTNYPPALKVFAGYVLLPLVMIFFVILYAYVFNTFTEEDWLESSIDELIFTLSSLGLLAYLLLWPQKFSEEAVWIKWYKEAFFYLLLPLMVLLSFKTAQSLAVKMMKADMFIQLILCIALSFISVYFIRSKTPSIRMIPIVLFMAFLAAGFGPYNAFERSEKFVKKDLLEVLQLNNRFKDGYFVSSEALINTEENTSIRKSFEYITSMFGFHAFDEFIQPEWKPAFNVEAEDYILRNALLDSMNIELYEYVNDRIEFTSVWRGPVPVSGYDYQVPLLLSVFDERVSLEALPEKSPFQWRFKQENQQFQIFTNADTVTFRISEMYKTLLYSGVESGFISDNSKMTFLQQRGDLKVQLLVTQIGFDKNSSAVKLESLSATCLVKLNNLP